MREASKDYPRRLWRRAWIVLDGCTALHYNGIESYVALSNSTVGEVFFHRKDAEYVQRMKREIAERIGIPDPKNIVIQSIAVPRFETPSPHVRTIQYATRRSKWWKDVSR
jgi:hypothetical protein